MSHTVRGHACVLTHHVFNGGEAQSPAAIAAAWIAGCSARLAATLLPGDSVDSVRVRTVASDSGDPPAFAEVPVTLAGSRSGVVDPLPVELVCVVTWVTGLAGRRHRGRNFFSGAVDADLVESTWVDAADTFSRLVAAYAGDLSSTFDPIGFDSPAQLVVWSRVPQPFEGSATMVSGHVVRPRAHWLRSRAA